MSVVVIGVNHRTSPLPLLERVAISGDAVAKVLHDVATRPNVSEAVVLSTCNRAEIYAACDDPDVQAAVRREFGDLYTFVERVSGRSEDEVRMFFAIGMLINVAAAMDLPALHEGWAGRCLGVCKR